MPISGLMITLAADPAAADDAVRALTACTAIELGVREDRRLAAVLDVPTEDENKRRWHWLNDLPGVAHTDVVFVSLDGAAPSDELPVPDQKEVAFP